MVKHFLEHWRSQNSATGKLLQAVPSWTQHQAGLPCPLFENPTKAVTCHVTTVRGCLASIGETIMLLGNGDKALMAMAVNLGKFSAKQLEWINAVRMHLQVSHSSETCNTRGTHVRIELAKGNLDQHHNPNTNAMKQPMPSGITLKMLLGALHARQRSVNKDTPIKSAKPLWA